ncbi:MAG TPA: hypothetical protein VKR06_00740 [Ktedonosporobacter sp.]|nr:hypothetical protein [Ktedonosporobacter sp.]
MSNLGRGKGKASHPYYAACVFPTGQHAQEVFQTLRDLIYYEKGCELSVYRFCHQRRWYVVVVGDQPEPDLHQRVQTVLHQHEGISTLLPTRLAMQLLRRRAYELQGGKTWVEHRMSQLEQERGEDR